MRTPLVPTPRTTSFPSGHAASAFAFAFAVSREIPAAALLLLPLAATVGYSRVYVGVHFPSDVVLGAAVGAGAGILVDDLLRRAWPDPDASRRCSGCLPAATSR